MPAPGRPVSPPPLPGLGTGKRDGGTPPDDSPDAWEALTPDGGVEKRVLVPGTGARPPLHGRCLGKKRGVCT